MSFGKSVPKVQMYEQMADTPYITNLRDLSQKGYEGYNKNYGRVDVFDQDTRRSLNDVLNNYYKRAESDFDRNYRDTMNRYQNKNYGQFGTLNATPALYRTDMENLQQQRKLADLAYNKSAYYDQLMNSELQRRYNTLNMYNQMLEKGQTPYELDLKNWAIRNQNKDRQLQNDIAEYNQSGNFGRFLGSFFDPLNIVGLRDWWGPTYQAQISGNSAQIDGQKALQAAMLALGIGGGFGGSSLGSNLSTTPWASSFNSNVMPSYGLGSTGSAMDWGRQSYLSNPMSKQDWLSSNSAMWTI